MTEEEKKAAEEAAAAEAEAKRIAEEEAGEIDPLKPDYKAMHEAEKKRADEAERVLAEKSFKEREAA
ncbi:MAG: protein TolA, partial [Patescibacteria group bacterium]